MKKTQSPAQKRQETLKVFFAYCCETYKNKLEGNDELLQQVYNIIAKMHGKGYMDFFYGNTRNNGIYLKMLEDFCENEPIKSTVNKNIYKSINQHKNILLLGTFRNWKIRQTSNEIIKLINEKL